MITILVSTASKGSSTFEFIRRVLSIHTNPCQALYSLYWYPFEDARRHNKFHVNMPRIVLPDILDGIPIQDMSKICFRYALDIPEVWPRYARDIAKICPRYAQHLPKVWSFKVTSAGTKSRRGGCIHWDNMSLGRWGRRWDNLLLGQNVF